MRFKITFLKCFVTLKTMTEIVRGHHCAHHTRGTQLIQHNPVRVPLAPPPSPCPLLILRDVRATRRVLPLKQDGGARRRSSGRELRQCRGGSRGGQRWKKRGGGGEEEEEEISLLCDSRCQKTNSSAATDPAVPT